MRAVLFLGALANLCLASVTNGTVLTRSVSCNERWRCE